MIILQAVGGAVDYIKHAIFSDVEKVWIHPHEHALTRLYMATNEDFSRILKEFKEECPKLSEFFQVHYKNVEHARNELDRTRQAIEEMVRSIFPFLTPEQREEVYGHVYQSAQVETEDLHWGQNHAFDNIPRLIRSIERVTALEGTTAKVVEFAKNEERLYARSRFYQLDSRPWPRDRAVGYINGIGTSFDLARGDAYRFSDELVRRNNIQCIWNATHGWLNDLIQTIKLYFGSRPEPVKLLLQQWNQFFKENPTSDRRYLQICFSQGTMMVRNALRELPPHLQNRICVIAIGPSCYFDPKPGFQVRHFAKASDGVATFWAEKAYRFKNERDPDIVRVQEDDVKDGHNPHSRNYQDAIRPFVHRYLDTGSIV